MWVPRPCRRRTLSRPLARDHDVAPLCKRGWAATFRRKTLRSASSLICCVPALPVGRMTASSQPCRTAVSGRSGGARSEAGSSVRVRTHDRSRPFISRVTTVPECSATCSSTSRRKWGKWSPAENRVVHVCAGRDEIVKERFMAKPVGPFSPWRRIGQTIATSGQIGLGEDGKLVQGGFGPELEQTLRNLASVLADAGVTREQVIKVNVYLADIA